MHNFHQKLQIHGNGITTNIQGERVSLFYVILFQILKRWNNSRLFSVFCCCVYSVASDSLWPWTVARQTPLSMGFFRQEYWSGLPRVLEWVAVSFSRRFCQPRDRTRVSRIAGRHFTVWATREVGCQFLLLRIFLTQGSNLCLLYFLHCSQILYLLSFGGSPILDEMQSQISVSRNKEKKSDSYSESSGGIGEEQICCDRDQEPFSCYFPISSSHVDDSYLTSTIIESKDPIFLE